MLERVPVLALQSPPEYSDTLHTERTYYINVGALLGKLYFLKRSSSTFKYLHNSPNTEHANARAAYYCIANNKPVQLYHSSKGGGHLNY